MSAPEQTRDQALAKVLPLLCRAAPVATTLRAADGGEITPEMRDALLAKCAAGEYVAVDLSMLAYEQRAGKPNRNYVRFADKAMKKLGASGADTPFLRDHEQWDVTARGGTVFDSATDATDGVFTVRQKTRLTAPWAVDMALRGLLDKVSIGWSPTGPIECSTCGTPIGTTCYHWPGDKVSESVGPDGGKVFLRDPNGKLTVEWVYTSADLIETSAVNVPGVPNAGIEDVRAALSAHFPAHGDGVIRPALAGPAPTPEAAPLPSAPPAATQSAQNQEPTMPTTEEMAAEIEKLKALNASAEARAAALTVEKDNALAEARAEKDREKRVVEAKAFATELGLDLEKAATLAREVKDFTTVKLTLLQWKVDEQKAIEIKNTLGARIEPGADSADKQHAAIGEAIAWRAIRNVDPTKLAAWKKKSEAEGKTADIPKAPTDDTVKRLSRARLTDLGDNFLNSAGVRTAGMSVGQIAELALTLSARGLGLTVDFPGLLANTANKLLLIGYSETPSPWRHCARRVDRPDFKQFKIVRRSGAPRLAKVNESGEIKSAGFNEQTPLVGQLQTAGVAVGFTRQMLINDDLDAFNETSLGLGDSAVAYEDDMAVIDILYGNPTLEDGTALFDSTRGNLSTDVGTPDITSIEAAAKMFAAMGETIQKPGSNLGTTTRKTQFSLAGFYGAIGEMMTIRKILTVPDGRMPAAAADAVDPALLNLLTLRDDRLQIEASSPDVHFAFSNRPGLVWGGLEGDPSPRLSMAYTATVDGVIWQLVHDTYVAVAEPKAIIRIPKS